MPDAPMHHAPAIGPIPATPPVRRSGRRWLVLAILIAFALGIGATIWALPHIQRWLPGRDSEGQVEPATTADRQPAPLLSAAPGSAQLLDNQVGQLEERLTRITVEAQGASSNAARAEGLLVAFAARRALDSGTPLGYIEGQLRLRFGQAQPRAVATIINAAREPVTIVDLRAGLLDVAAQLTTAPADGGWWPALEQEARALVTFRKTSTPSPRPQAALDRALRYIDAGRVTAALTEVDRMPNKAVADRWAQYARRYMEAHRALDLIETAAILEPRQLRSADGLAVEKTSPLAP
jgi:signal transduction histidine kinase